MGQQYSMPDYEWVHKEMQKSGVTLSLLWVEYCERCRQNGELPYKSTQFNKYYADYVHKTKATMHLEHKPGENLQVDWAGQTAGITDTDTGERLPAYLFVAVLPYSGYAYEDNVSGRLSDTLFEQMLRDFEAELSDLTEIISQDQQELERISRETINAEKFLSLVRKYTDFSELTPAMINEFVEKILVHQAQGKGASRTQEIEIFFNFVGKVDIPHKEVELTEEEKAALAEQERRRAKKAEYNRRYMEKKRRQWKEQQEQEQAEQLPLAAEQKGEHIA